MKKMLALLFAVMTVPSFAETLDSIKTFMDNPKVLQILPARGGVVARPTLLPEKGQKTAKMGEDNDVRVFITGLDLNEITDGQVLGKDVFNFKKLDCWEIGVQEFSAGSRVVRLRKFTVSRDEAEKYLKSKPAK